MYIAGRFRTASSPLRTWIESALYLLESFGAVMMPRHSESVSFRSPHDPLDGFTALAQPRQDRRGHELKLLHPCRRGDPDEQRSVLGDALGRRYLRNLRADQAGPL